MPDTDRQNVLLILTDQHRADCIGADPHCPEDADGRPLVHTPNINNFVEEGALCTRAHTPKPTCFPARGSLWSGQEPASWDMHNADEWAFEATLPAALRDAGYQTFLAGKTHARPLGNRIGFEERDLHTGLWAYENDGMARSSRDDYQMWLDERVGRDADEESLGLGRDGWGARPWHLDEHLHPTHWTTTRMVDFFDRRLDPTRPFFATLSYVRPHPPIDPPRALWDIYIDRETPDPAIGDWVEDRHAAEMPAFPTTGDDVADHPPSVVHRARAGYYALITQIDQQLKRLNRHMSKAGVWDETLVVFAADHGEMLGDHYLWQKQVPYEQSVRVPLVVKFPESWDVERRQFLDRPVGLEDVMPTVLDAAGIDIPDSVDGRSLLPLFSGAADGWREYYHGENDRGYRPETSYHYLAGEDIKYIWNAHDGSELLFDHGSDPAECHDRSEDPAYADRLEATRAALVDRLRDRPEGFVADGELRPVDHDDWRR
ncbi:MAG: sulfatase-like hydrolase/transferase [Halobacteriaceae archaeon]